MNQEWSGRVSDIEGKAARIAASERDAIEFQTRNPGNTIRVHPCLSVAEKAYSDLRSLTATIFRSSPAGSNTSVLSILRVRLDNDIFSCMRQVPVALVAFAVLSAAMHPALSDDRNADNATKPSVNHQLLGEFAGKWNYVLKISRGPDKPPIETTGVVVRQPIMAGRYYLADFNVEILPGASGELEHANFQGKEIEGYDNIKQRFFSVWIDNASTSVTVFEGTYDSRSRTFTYTAETEPQPGKKTKVREQIRLIDGDHYTLEWFEEHGGREIKTIEIAYTRASKV